MPDDKDASFQRLLGHAESEFRKRRHGSEARRVALAERQAFEHELQISQSFKADHLARLEDCEDQSSWHEKQDAHTRRRSPLEKYLISELDVLLESSAHAQRGRAVCHTSVCVPSTWCIRPEVLSKTACAVVDLPVDSSSFQQLLRRSEPNMGKERRGANAAALVERRTGLQTAESTGEGPPTPSSQPAVPPTPCTRSSVDSTPMHGVFAVPVGAHTRRPSSAGGAGGSNVVRGPDACACGGGASSAHSRRFARPHSASQPALRHRELASSRRSSGPPSRLLGDGASRLARPRSAQPALRHLGRDDVADAAGGSNVARGSDSVNRSIQANCRVGEGQSELATAHGACGGGEWPVRGQQRFARPSSAQPALHYLEPPTYPWGTRTELEDTIAARQRLGQASPTRSARSRSMPASTLAGEYMVLPPDPEPRPPHRGRTASDGQLQSEAEVQMLRLEALASKVAEGQLLFSVLSDGELHGEVAPNEACSGRLPPPGTPTVRVAGIGGKNTVRAWAWRCGEG